ncbi:MAG TPA: hypothetical protein VKD25_04140 [Burkholderiales bacterium]|nr:hypothetical protein [Burkholderiales bacterium]
MINTLLVALAVAAGVPALVGVPLRCWQIATGRFRSRIPQHALARATFRVFAALFLVPNVLAWAYVLHAGYQYLACGSGCEQRGVAAVIAIGFLGCAYVLLEGFLLTARRRVVPDQ